ncbi:MAG: DUF6498-containing protein [Thermoanaerobaculia bacterium]
MSWLSRVTRLLLRLAAQGAPLAGVFGEGWSPAGGLMLYWAESALLFGSTMLLLELWIRRTRPPLSALQAAGIRPRDVAIGNGAMFAIFGLLFTGFLIILVANGFVELQALLAAAAGLPWVLGIVLLELLVDLARSGSATTADFVRRVDAGSRRVALFWFVGFFGILAAAFTGRPLVLFALFAALKILFEIGGAIERLQPSRAGAAAKVSF